MRVRVEFTLSPAGAFPADELPLVLELERTSVAVHARSEARELDLNVELPVARSTIRVQDDVARKAETGRRLETLDVPETTHAAVVANRVADSIAFITRTAMTVSRKSSEAELIAEDDADVACLHDLGAREVVSRLCGGSPGVWPNWPLAPENIAFLWSRPEAVRLYADALKMGTSTGRLRELWRVLEAAFGEQGKKLVGYVSQCDAAIEMEFSAEELEDLRTLRGRASHAQSSAGLGHAVAVEQEAARVVNRVQGLAEALIIRKVHWGDRTVAVHTLDRPLSYVRRDGSIVLHVAQEEVR